MITMTQKYFKQKDCPKAVALGCPGTKERVCAY